MWYIAFKTTNLVNGRVYYGIHRTMDPFFGSESYFDGYIGDTNDMNKDLKQFGRKAFLVEGIEAFPERDGAERRIAPMLANPPPNCYHTNARSESHKGLQNALGTVRSEEFKQAVSERIKGENNPFYGQKHTDNTKQKLKQHRASIMWVNNGIIEKQIPKSDNIPEQWCKGRLKPNSTMKVTVTKAKKDEGNQEVSPPVST
jgi:hypothetical protein